MRKEAAEKYLVNMRYQCYSKAAPGRKEAIIFKDAPKHRHCD
jgi:hypothetical protein